MITIDNNSYDVGIVKITRRASQKIENLGTTMDLRKHYDIQGTYYDYDVELATKLMSLDDYDNLYELLTTPQESHTVTLPYGQSTLTFEARVSVASDVLVQSFNTFKKWRKHKSNIRGINSTKGGMI